MLSMVTRKAFISGHIPGNYPQLLPSTLQSEAKAMTTRKNHQLAATSHFAKFRKTKSISWNTKGGITGFYNSFIPY